MGLEGRRVAVWPGDGLVERRGDTIALLLGKPARGSHGHDQILAACAAGGGADLARRLGRLVLDAEAGRLPAFAVVTADPQGLIAFCHGAVEIGALAGGAPLHLSGQEAVTWVERRLPEPVERLSIGPPGLAGAAMDRRCDLRDGIVSGGGISVLPREAEDGAAPEADDAGAPAIPGRESAVDDPPAPAAPGPVSAAAVPAEPPISEEAPGGAVVTDDTSAGGAPAPAAPDGQEPAVPSGEVASVQLTPDPARLADREPLPVHASDEIAEPARPVGGPGPVIVQGVRCSRDHHNDPAAVFCSSCGIRMGAHRTLIPVPGPRPPLGVFVLDDGSTIPVQVDMVIGREPSVDPRVRRRDALGVRIDDDTNSVSRAHLCVSLEAWDVLITDNRSSNGTEVRLEKDGAWRRLVAGERIQITTGAEVRIGERLLVFDQHHVHRVA